MPLETTEIPSGTPILDWTVPLEWSIDDAYIADRSGRRLVDFAESNLHVVSYSAPVRGTFRFEEIRDRLFTLPDRPELIPYRTSYWNETWGFCLAHERLEELERAGELEVVIESRLAPGHMVYGEIVIPGQTPDEVLLSTHVCHPSLANDNLSGVALLATIARRLMHTRPRLTHRFLFSPGTVGPIAWLARNGSALERIRHGLVVVSVGDPGPLTYKRSRRGTPPSTGRPTTCCRGARGRPYATSSHGDATSASSARPDSISRSDASCGHRLASTPRTTHPRTTSRSSPPRRSATPDGPASRSSPCSRRTGPS